MQQPLRQPLPLRRLGKLDDLVRENGKNQDDGWNWSVKAGNDRVPSSPRKEPKRR